MWSPQRLCRRVAEQLELLRRMCEPERFETRRARVSGWSVGEHIQHLAVADRSILDAIEQCLDADGERVMERGRPRLSGYLVLLSGWIPRGRATAPAAMLPQGGEAASVAAELETLARGFRGLEDRQRELRECRRALAHPLLGAFTALRWLRFVDVHQRHHLAIMFAIERSRGS